MPFTFKLLFPRFLRPMRLVFFNNLRVFNRAWSFDSLASTILKFSVIKMLQAA
jgi:hypothetical protein